MGIASERDVAEFLVTYTRDMALSTEDPGTILDRYFVPDFVYCNDGIEIDRQRMIDHVRPVRRNVAESPGAEIHETLFSGNRFAVRWTLRTKLRKGATFEAEIHTFGHLAEDGRIERIDQLSRQLH